MRRSLAVIALIGVTVHLNAQHWTVPRTPWGDPDLQGYWPSRDMLGVPLERPARLGDRATLTDEEFAKLDPRPADSRTRTTRSSASLGRTGASTASPSARRR